MQLDAVLLAVVYVPAAQVLQLPSVPVEVVFPAM